MINKDLWIISDSSVSALLVFHANDEYDLCSCGLHM